MEVPGSAAEGAVFAGSAVEVVAPFPHIAAEVEDSEFIGRIGVHRRGEFVFGADGLVVVAVGFSRRVFAAPGVVAGFLAAGGGVGLEFEREADGGAPLEIGGEAVEMVWWKLADL